MFLTFNNTILLIGLAGAVVPFILHLLSRSHYMSVDWGAMIFLEGMEAREQHSTRLNQIMLLIVRMLLVAVLAIALAQPQLQQWGPGADAGAAALRTADHGQLLCIAGAVTCAIALLGMVIFLASSAGRQGLAARRLVLIMLAVGAGVGVFSFGRRAAAWETEVRRLMTQQPQSPASAPFDAALHRRVDVAILLDCSSSMNFEENGHTRFSMGQAAAKQVLAGLNRGDRVTLILLGTQQTAAEMEPTTDLQSVADRIDAARTSHEPADVADGLIQAQRILDRDGRSAHDLYIVGDRQALSWRGITDYFVSRRWPDAIRQSLAVRIFAVPVGSHDAENVAIQSIRLTNPPAILGQPVDVEVDVHNYGSAPRAALPLAVSVNGRVASELTVNVPPGRVARVTVPLKGSDFTSPGAQVISAEVRTTGYREDDRLDSVVEAIEPIRVLIISGDESDTRGTDGDLAPEPSLPTLGQFRSESDFVRLALAPLQALQRKGPDPCRVEVISEEQWARVDLQQYQVVVLANVERFGAAQARAIEQYVYGGGGLLVAPGSLTRVEDYNDALWRDGAGILPAELLDATSSDGSEATTIVGYDPDTPVFQFLHDRPDLMLSPTIGRFFPTNARPSDSRALAWYTSGSPFLIESHAGRGKVLLMTTSLDADWSTLPLSSFYLPFVQSAARYLSSGTVPSHNIELGEAIQLTLDQAVEDRATLESPDGDQRQVSLTRFGATAEFHFADTSVPGVYRLRLNGGNHQRNIAFAVQLPQAESDLTHLTEKRWADLEPGLHLQRIDPSDRPIAAVVAGSREGYDLWPWALAAVLLLASIELGLARRWSRDSY
jgi:hypothetical protein